MNLNFLMIYEWNLQFMKYRNRDWDFGIRTLDIYALNGYEIAIIFSDGVSSRKIFHRSIYGERPKYGPMRWRSKWREFRI